MTLLISFTSKKNVKVVKSSLCSDESWLQIKRFCPNKKKKPTKIQAFKITFSFAYNCFYYLFLKFRKLKEKNLSFPPTKDNI
jgi:hypothetical protein